MPISSNLSTPVRSRIACRARSMSIKYISLPRRAARWDVQVAASTRRRVAPASRPTHAVVGEDQHVFIRGVGLDGPFGKSTRVLDRTCSLRPGVDFLRAHAIQIVVLYDVEAPCGGPVAVPWYPAL